MGASPPTRPPWGRSREHAGTVNDDVKLAVVTSLDVIPEVGAFLSLLVDILWPDSRENVWEEIESQVEALIKKELADLEYNQVKEDLDGLQNVIDDYLEAVTDSQQNTTYISEKYNVALGSFQTAQSHFMASGYEVLLLPLMANLHLALLQDGVRFGKQWGWTDKIVADTRTNLATQIQKYGLWASPWYQNGLNSVPLPTSGAHLSTRRWQAQNSYVRQMTLIVLDNAYYWPYFDPGVTAGTYLRLRREVYSDPEGTADDNPIGVDPLCAQPITNLNAWGWDRVDAIQVAYGGTWGPRMGDQSGGSNQPPHGWTGAIAAGNPVTGVAGFSGDILNSVLFGFKNGQETKLIGGNYCGGSPYVWKLDAHVLSSVKIMGQSAFYDSADCAIFGFRYEDSYDLSGVAPPATAPVVKF